MNSKMKKQACATGGLWKYKSVRTGAAGKKLASRTEGFSAADFDFDNLGASLALYSSRLILLYSDGRQTAENHLIYMGTSPY